MARGRHTFNFLYGIFKICNIIRQWLLYIQLNESSFLANFPDALAPFLKRK
jgi:hypothetical protein